MPSLQHVSFRTAIVAAAALVSATSFAQANGNGAQPPASETPPQVTGVLYSGTGCPEGSAAVSISPDGQVFTLIFDSFLAELSGTVTNRVKTRCRIEAILDVPTGWSYALASVDYRGYARLEPGVSATQQSTYSVKSSPRVASAKTVLTGDYDADYLIHDVSFDGRVWSKCGKGDRIRIDTEIDLRREGGSQGAGLMTVDSMDGTLTHVYALVWRRC